MQKVRSYFKLKFTRAAYKTTISNRSFTVLYTIAYILYLALEEGSPLYSNKFHSFYLFNLSVDCNFYYPSNVNTTYLLYYNILLIIF